MHKMERAFVNVFMLLLLFERAYSMRNFIDQSEKTVEEYMCKNFVEDGFAKVHKRAPNVPYNPMETLSCETLDYEDADYDAEATYFEELPPAEIQHLQAMFDTLTLASKTGKGRDYVDKRNTKEARFVVKRVFRYHDKVTKDVYDAIRSKIATRGRVDADKVLSRKCLSSPGEMGNPPIDGLEVTDAGEQANEMFLFHGTDPDTVPLILRGGFNERWANFGGLFGAGSYFAEYVSKVDQYTTRVKEDKNIYMMVFARVAMGKYLGGVGRAVDRNTAPVRPGGMERLFKGVIGRAKMRKTQDVLGVYKSQAKKSKNVDWTSISLIGEGANTVGSDKFREMSNSDGNEFVVFNGAQAYPELVIFYERQEGQVKMLQNENSYTLVKNPGRAFGGKTVTAHFGPYHILLRTKKGKVEDMIEFHRIQKVECKSSVTRGNKKTWLDITILHEANANKARTISLGSSCRGDGCRNGYVAGIADKDEQTKGDVKMFGADLEEHVTRRPPTNGNVATFENMDTCRPPAPQPPRT